jgi:hypothetical protein
MARRKAIPFVIRSQDEPSPEVSRKSNRPRKPREPREPLFTIEDAFSRLLPYKHHREDRKLKDPDLAERHCDVERGLRAAA